MINVNTRGIVGQDPELRQTQNNLKVATYSIATYRQNPKDKEHPITDWFNVVAWGEQADLVMDNLKKGTKIFIVGKLQKRSYEDKDGKKVEATDIVQDELYIKPEKKEEEFVQPITDDDLPF